MLTRPSRPVPEPRLLALLLAQAVLPLNYLVKMPDIRKRIFNSEFSKMFLGKQSKQRDQSFFFFE